MFPLPPKAEAFGILAEQLPNFQKIACEKAFQQAKNLLASSKVLVHYNPAIPIKMSVDASAYGVGAVISHVLPNGDEKPITNENAYTEQESSDYHPPTPEQTTPELTSNASTSRYPSRNRHPPERYM